MTLGHVLRWHRSLCTTCTTDDVCDEYLEITTEYTEPRRIYTGSTAPHTILSIREVIT
jgi:hypothetical protein